MKLSVIIVAWEAQSRISDCLDALLPSLSPIDAQVTVIDNASHDSTADIIARNYPTVKLIKNKENVGFAAANNQGWITTTSEYVLLLNDDALVQPHTVKILVEWLDQHPSAGGVTCRFDNADGTIQRGYHRGLPTLGRMAASFAHHYLNLTSRAAKDFLLLNEDFSRVRVIEQAAATCLLLRRDAVTKSGGLFDERFPIFFNDADLAHRLNQHQWFVWLTPDTAITHLRAQSTEKLDPYRAKEMYYQGLFSYFKKNKHLGDYFFGKTLFIGMLAALYGLTRLGITKSYFGAPIIDRQQSLQSQHAVIKRLIAT